MMLTIDWKDRLKRDTLDYLEHKLPNNDYDFEIIYIAYPERVNGKIPAEVIVHVAHTMVQHLGKAHEKYLPFYKHLWEKKGENGKTAFVAFMAKLAAKKPATYLPLIEQAVNSANAAQLAALLEKVMLPLLRKQTEQYLPAVYAWTRSAKPVVRDQAVKLLIKLLKKDPQHSAVVLHHFVNLWLQPLGEQAAEHLTLLKAVAKLDPDIYLGLWRQHLHSRDPQSAELLCGSIQFYHPEIEALVENWTKSGNARLKKTALAAQKLLQKKKA